MLHTILPFIAFLFLVVSAALFYDGISTSQLTQTVDMIGGAIFLSLGLVSLWSGIKNWWKWRTLYKENANE